MTGTTQRLKRLARGAVAGVLCALAGCLVLGTPTAAAAGRCPNEELRIGRSAALPDCRAYELVTPEELGRTADLAFFGSSERVLPASDGEHIALETEGAYLEPSPNFETAVGGTFAVLSRTSTSWAIKSAVAPGMAPDAFSPEIYSPDLSRVALQATNALDSEDDPEATPSQFDVGPIGGPYTTLASVPKDGEGTKFEGGNAGTESVAPFSQVVFSSPDHAVLPAGSHEREVAEETQAGEPDLYEWRGGGSCEAAGSSSSCRLVNVEGEGEHTKLLNKCGARLWTGEQYARAVNAVSAGGSKVFFTSPAEPCEGEQRQLYMRVDGRETVDVSAPQGVTLALDERGAVVFQGATPDGSKVFFASQSELTPGAGGPGWKVYEYDTEAPQGERLILVATYVASPNNPWVDVAEDGSAVYYQGYGEVPGYKGVDRSGIFRYETATGRRSFVSTKPEAVYAGEEFYVTPNGEFLMFPGEPIPACNCDHPEIEFLGPHGFEIEPRGNYHNELYRYDAATGASPAYRAGKA